MESDDWEQIREEADKIARFVGCVMVACSVATIAAAVFFFLWLWK